MTARVDSREAALLSCLRAVLREAPGLQLRALLHQGPTLREGLSPEAWRLLRQDLRHGCVRALVRHGAWRRRRELRSGEPREGRLWTLHPELTLDFGPASYALCRWLCSGGSALPQPALRGDHLLAYLGAGALVAAGQPPQPLAASPLVCLAWADQLTEVPAALDWAPWCRGSGALVLTALQARLGRRWEAMERAKAGLGAEHLLACGQRQEAVLGPFLDAIDAAGRRDLAGFLVEAAVPLAGRPDARAWVTGLRGSRASLRLRSAACRAAAGFLRALGRIARWREELALVSFIDDAYAEAQQRLAAWEPLGLEGFRRIEQLCASLQSLRCLSGSA